MCRFTVPGAPANVADFPDLVSGTLRLVEWSSSTSVDYARARIELVEARLPSDVGDPYRDEEARTLASAGIFVNQARDGGLGVIYRSLPAADAAAGRVPLSSSSSSSPLPPSSPPSSPTAWTLRDVIEGMPRPSTGDRRALSHIILTQVRSLHVHFDLVHGALRPDSFVFFAPDAASLPNLSQPYVLDWTRNPETRGMHQHPGFRADAPDVWAYDVWAALMVISQIADWRMLDDDDGGGGDDGGRAVGGPAGPAEQAALFERKRARKNLVTSSEWKGDATASVFRFGFAAIDCGLDEVAARDRWERKRFWDRMCALLQ
jgi:hypothetical protein